jgi:predicted dehydrogenase
MEPLRIAVAGAGWISGRHLAATGETPMVRRLGVFDQVAEKAQSRVDEFELPRRYGSWDEILQDPEVECVLLAVPPDAHMPMAIEALSAGKHVVSEKPMGRTVEECDRMVAAEAESGRRLFPVHNRVFGPAIVHVKEALERGEIGEVFLVQSSGFEPPSLPNRISWLKTELSLGGVLLAQAVHPIYALRWLLGPVEGVHLTNATTKVVDMTREDTTIASIRFESGAVATMTSTFAIAHGPLGHEINIFGKEGFFRISSDQRLSGIVPRVFGDEEMHEIPVGDPNAHSESFRNMWEHYATAIRTGGPSRVTARDGRDAVAIVMAAYESAERGDLVRPA